MADVRAWFRERGFRVTPFPRLMWYLYPRLVEQGLRFEQPFQERLFRIGKELGRRLHEQGITWWDRQLEEYEAIPHWRDIGKLWEDALAKHFKVDIADYPFWLVTSRSMQYSWGNNVGLQLIKELADIVARYPGEAPVYVEAITSLGSKMLVLGSRVHPIPDFYAEAKTLLGEAAVA